MAHASGLPSAPVISFNATSKIFETAILGFEPPSDGGSIITGYQFATDSQTSGVLGNWQEIIKHRNLTNTAGKQIVLVYLQMPSPRNYINFSIRAVNSNGPGVKSVTYQLGVNSTMPKPFFGIPVVTSDGFSTQITNFNPFANYEIIDTSTSGGAGITTALIDNWGKITVTGMDPDQVETVTVRATYSSQNLSRSIVETNIVIGSPNKGKIPIPDIGLYVDWRRGDLISFGTENPLSGFDFLDLQGATFSCTSTFGNCNGFVPFQVTELLKDQTTTMTVEASASGYLSSTFTFTANSLKAGFVPRLANLKKELGGCSFDIINYDSNFKFYFKRMDSDVSISPNGHVVLSGQENGTSREDYPSSSRENYEIINNLAELFVCTALSQIEITQLEILRKEAELRLAAEIARKEAIARQELAKKVLESKLLAGNFATVEDFRKAGFATVSENILENVNASILLLEPDDRKNYDKIINIISQIQFNYIFFNSSKKPETSDYLSYGISKVTERILNNVNDAVSNLPVDKRFLDEISKLVTIISIVDRISHQDSNKSVTVADLIKIGAMPPETKFSSYILYLIRKMPAGEIDSVEEIKSQVLKQISRIQERQNTLEKLKSRR